MMKARDVILCWDFLTACGLAIIVFFVTPTGFELASAKDIFAIAISVLSIVFSVFFAALAMIISASDNEFVVFLEAEQDYTGLIRTFEVSLLALFVALLYSLSAYFAVVWLALKKVPSIRHAWLALMAFLFAYGLFAAFNSALDAIRYAKRRAAFLRAKQGTKPAP